MIYIYFVRYRSIIRILEIVGEVFGVGDNIRPVQFFKIAVIHQPERFLGEMNAFIV